MISEQNRDQQDLLKMAVQQAEGELRTLQMFDSAFKNLAFQAAALSLPIAMVAPVPWLFIGQIVDFYNRILIDWLPTITPPGFFQTLFLMIFTFFAAFLVIFQHFFRIRLDNWDAMIWRWEKRFNVNIDRDPTIGEPTPKAERVDRLARLILERHYLDNQDTSREACEGAHLCSQREWNAVNLVLKKLGIKGERSWLAADYNQAFGLYRWRVSVDGDAIVIMHEKDKGFERLKFDEDK